MDAYLRLDSVIHVNRARIAGIPVSGVPVFRGTRVPVQILFDYLNDNLTIREFLEDFPTVKKEQVVLFLSHLQTFTIEVSIAA
jgi:uncharacterized protein (DUF433 family)